MNGRKSVRKIECVCDREGERVCEREIMRERACVCACVINREGGKKRKKKGERER